MAERRPPGFNVDIGFYDSAEVLSIPRKLRAAAIGVWTLCGSYSANKLSDGAVPAEKLKEFGCTPAIRAALMSTTPEPLWVEGPHPGAIQFTRWTKWQRTCAEVKAYREAEAERKRNARNAKRNATTSRNGETSARTSEGHPPDVRPESRDPKTETETETKNSGYVPESATEPNGRDAIAATPGADLVRAIIPAEHPDAVKTALRLRASELINRGTPTETVAAALRLWLTKPNLGPNTLPALVSEVIKTANGHARAAPVNGLTAGEAKVVGWAQLGEPNPDERKAIRG